MRIVLIGGNGFIGTPLARELADSGHQVAVVHRSANPDGIENGIRRIRGDRNNLLECRDQLREFAPDAMVDLILSSGRQAQDLMNVAHGTVGRVVALSSMDVYRAWGVFHGIEPGGLEPLPLTEDSPLRSNRNLYAPEAVKAMQSVFPWLEEHYDKIAVEQTVMNDPEVSGTVLRLPMVYGPGDRHRFFPLLKRIADGRSFVILADDLAVWRGPREYVENIAHAVMVAATSDRAAGRIYNVCEEPTWPEIEWQKRIAEQLNWRGRFVVLPRDRVPGHLLMPGNAAQHVVASSERIRSELNYREPVDTEEAIRRTISWEHRNPPGSIDPRNFEYDAEDAALGHAAV